MNASSSSISMLLDRLAADFCMIEACDSMQPAFPPQLLSRNSETRFRSHGSPKFGRSQPEIAENLWGKTPKVRSHSEIVSLNRAHLSGRESKLMTYAASILAFIFAIVQLSRSSIHRVRQKKSLLMKLFGVLCE